MCRVIGQQKQLSHGSYQCSKFQYRKQGFSVKYSNKYLCAANAVPRRAVQHITAQPVNLFETFVCKMWHSNFFKDILC